MPTESHTSKSYGDETIRIKGPTKTYEVIIEDGDWDCETEPAERIVVYDRTDIAGLRKGKKKPGKAKFTVNLLQFTDLRSGVDTILDVIEGTGNWANEDSVAGPEYEQRLVQIERTVAGIEKGDAADHVVTYDKCFLWYTDKSGDIDKIVVNVEIYDNNRPIRTGPTS